MVTLEQFVDEAGRSSNWRIKYAAYMWRALCKRRSI